MPLAEHSLGRHSNEMREVLIKILKEPFPESYKAGWKVMEAALGHAH